MGGPLAGPHYTRQEVSMSEKVLPSGKGVYIWNIANCGWGSDMPAMAAALHAAGFGHVTIKILQSKYDIWSGTASPKNKALLPVLVPELQSYGIHVRGYQYNEGESISNSGAEAAAAVETCTELNLDGLDIDVEAEFNQPGQTYVAGQWAKAYLDGLVMHGLPAHVSVSVATYRFPSVQPYFPWTTFLEHSVVDFVMPQVYWQGAHNPAYQLNKSFLEYQGYGFGETTYRPIGSAYCEWGWCATTADVIQFSDAAKGMGLEGISFWSLEHIRSKPEMWETIVGLQWKTNPDPPPIPPPDPDPDPEPGVYQPQVMVVQSETLNVRSYATSNPSGTANIVDKLHYGDQVQVFKVDPVTASSVWAKISPDQERHCAIVHGGKVYLK